MKKVGFTVTPSPVLTIAALGSQGGVGMVLVSKEHNRQKNHLRKEKILI